MQAVIEHINASFADLLQDLDIKAYSLAESVSMRSEDEVTFPALVLPDGECISVYGETDQHDITLYHRLNGVSYQEDTASSVGSRNGYTETDDMSLIVFGKRESLSPLEAERAARLAIAKQKPCSLSQSDFASLQIFASEYVGVSYFMSPAYYLFKINYRITGTFSPRCN